MSAPLNSETFTWYVDDGGPTFVTELEVVVLADVVDQARVERTQGVYVASSVVERRGRPAGGRVLERPAVVISADLILAGLQSGWLALISAATPATCGHDMDVPDKMLNPTRRRSVERLDGLASPLHAAKMFTPGAMTSGLRISRVRTFGPRDENAATTGDGRIPSLVPSKLSFAVGFALVLLYFFAAMPWDSPTATAGSRWLSATSSSPLAAVLASIIPTPPAFFTT
nr:unnamed protein product [Digitaria exilis]